MTTFTARPYAEIAATRRVAILTGAKILPKGACHFCDFALPKPALYCCADCSNEYQKERAALAG